MASEGKPQGRRDYTERTIKLLFARSGGMCAHPDCNIRLVAPATDQDSAAITGQIAHIIPFSPNGPRGTGVSSLLLKELNDYENLVLLCGTHHALVDKQPSSFPEEMLRGWKKATEDRVEALLVQNMANLQFPELQQICDAIVESAMTVESTRLVAPDLHKKLDANDLGPRTAGQIQLGLAQTPQIEKYLSYSSLMQPNFGERLRGGFVTKYNELVANGESGDSLFDSLQLFAIEAASRPKDDNLQRARLAAASLAVMTYLFQVCDLFEEVPDAVTE